MFNILRRKEADSIQNSALDKLISTINKKIEREANAGKGYCSVEVPWGSQYKLVDLYTDAGYDVDWWREDKTLWSCVPMISIRWEK